ncbi:MAG: hypothetical protein ACTS1Z_03755 [Parasphingopyxis sp.]
MPRKKLRSPQEKKSLSYKRDRRNNYRANDKASRKAIPARKAIENKKSRRKAGHSLKVVDRLSEDDAAIAESSLLHDVERVGGWRKCSDEPLRDHILSQERRREMRHNRKRKYS